MPDPPRLECPFCEMNFHNEEDLKHHQMEQHLDPYFQSIEHKLRGKFLGTFDKSVDQIFAFKEHIISRQKVNAYLWNGMIHELYKEYRSELKFYKESADKPIIIEELSNTFNDLQEDIIENYQNYYFLHPEKFSQTTLIDLKTRLEQINQQMLSD